VNAPLKPQMSGRSRETPQPELIPQRSSRRTPAQEQLKRRPSTRKDPITTTAKKRGRPSKKDVLEEGDMNVVPKSYPTQSDGEGTVTKKRKIGGDLIDEAQDLPKSREPSKGRPKATINPHDSLAQTDDSLITDAPAEIPQKKRKKRKSIGQNSTKKRPGLAPTRGRQDPIRPHVDVAASAVDLEPVMQEEMITSPGKQLVRELDSQTEVPDSTGTEVQQAPEAEEIGSPAEQAHSLEEPVDAGTGEEDPVSETEEQPIKSKKRKKRKSIGQVQKPRKKSTGSTPIQAKDSSRTRTSISKVKAATTPSQAKSKRKRPLPESETAEHDGIEDDQGTDLIDPTAVPVRKKGGPKQPLSALNDENQDSPQTHIKKSGRLRKSTIPTAPKTKTKTKTASKPSQSKKQKARRKQPPQNTIPITVHRLSRPLPPSSTITFPAPPLKTPNAIDILSQFCCELLSKPLRPTTASSSSPSSLERKRKQRTVEIYSEELEARLFDLTQTLDMNTSLTTRVRLARREEKGLMSELKALKDEIQGIQTRKKELREQREKSIRERELVALLAGIENAVKQGREKGWDESEEMGMGGFEVLARKVAGGLQGGGILEKVKGMRGVLESVVEAL